MNARGGPLALAVLLAASPARPEATVAVVAGADADSPQVVDAVWALRAALDARGPLRAASVSDRLADTSAVPVDEGRAALEEGRQAFADLDVERAARALEAAARLLGSVASERDAVVEALDLLAQTRCAAHDEVGAAVVYARLVAFDPEFAPDLESLGPTVTKAWKRARNLAKLGPAGPLRVDSALGPAAVFLAGRYVGVTPQVVTPSGLSAELELRADGFAPWARTIALRPATSASIEPALEPLPKSALLLDIEEKLPGQWERETVGPALKDLRALLVTEQAILVGFKGGEIRAQLYDLKVGRRVREVRRSADGPSLSPPDAAALIDDLYNGVDVAAPGTTELAEAEPESLDGRSGPRIYGAWWFWPAVGVAAATAVVVPLVVLSGDEETALRERDGKGAVLFRF